jgi:hypothetical protein
MKEKFIENYLNWLRQNVFVNEVENGKKWVINSPFLDRHNDYIEIYIIKKEEDTFILTDDGFVYNDLLTSGCDPISSPKRKELFKLDLLGFGVNFKEKTHEIYVETSMEEIGKNKHKLAQAMISIGDMFMLASANVSTIFKEDVKAFFRRKDIPFNYDLKITGKSFIEHTIEIALPLVKDNPETIIKVINNPIKSYAINAIFTFNDIKEIRKEIRSVVIYNDEQKVAKGFIQALRQYKIECVAWSEREEYSSKILKNYQK